MKYIYILQSELNAEHYYSGITDNLTLHLAGHNAGEVKNTSKSKPLQIKTYIAFNDDKKALEFEQYLKSGLGRKYL